MWMNLPTAMQRILIATFNSVFNAEVNDGKESKKAEITALRIAWSTAKEKYVKNDDGDWVARTGNNVALNMENQKFGVMKCTNRFAPKRSYEDNHFVGYNICLTTVGVMNGAFKPADEIRNIVSNLPDEHSELLPNVDDHPQGWEVEIPQGKEDTFVTNMWIEDDENYPKCWGTVLISKNDEWKIDAIESGALIESSIGYMFNWDDTGGEFKGSQYDHIERNITLFHNAFMVTQSPACTPEMGCGINDGDDEVKKDCPCKLQSKEKDEPEGDSMKNEISDTDKRERLRALLPTDADGWGPWVADVFNAYFVYEDDDKYFWQAYFIDDDDNVSLVGGPEEVLRETEYKKLNGDSMESDEQNDTVEDENTTEDEVVEEVIEEESTEETESETETETTESEENDETVEEENTEDITESETVEEETTEEEVVEEVEDEVIEEETESDDNQDEPCPHEKIISDLNDEKAELKIKADLWDNHCETERNGAISQLKKLDSEISEDQINSLSTSAINMIIKAHGKNESTPTPVNIGGEDSSTNSQKEKLIFGYTNEKGEWVTKENKW